MKKRVFMGVFASIFSLLSLNISAMAQEEKEPAKLTVTLDGIADGQPIPAKFAYCVPDGKGQYSETGGNINPAISWSGAPATTKSYALIVVDRDVPASFENANQAGKTIAADFPRQNFYHWVLVDIPPSITQIAEGVDSKGITPGGKIPGKKEYGLSGQNSYPMAGKGQGGGYDGPCPPWNDERVHHYHFMVYALDIPTLGLQGIVTGQQAQRAMEGHILAQGEVTGTYTDNLSLPH